MVSLICNPPKEEEQRAPRSGPGQEVNVQVVCNHNTSYQELRVVYLSYPNLQFLTLIGMKHFRWPHLLSLGCLHLPCMPCLPLKNCSNRNLFTLSFAFLDVHAGHTFILSINTSLILAQKNVSFLASAIIIVAISAQIWTLEKSTSPAMFCLILICILQLGSWGMSNSFGFNTSFAEIESFHPSLPLSFSTDKLVHTSKYEQKNNT